MLLSYLSRQDTHSFSKSLWSVNHSTGCWGCIGECKAQIGPSPTGTDPRQAQQDFPHQGSLVWNLFPYSIPHSLILYLFKICIRSLSFFFFKQNPICQNYIQTEVIHSEINSVLYKTKTSKYLPWKKLVELGWNFRRYKHFTLEWMLPFLMIGGWGSSHGMKLRLFLVAPREARKEMCFVLNGGDREM